MKVETENPNFDRDINSKALISKNAYELEQYRQRISEKKTNAKQIQMLRESIDEFKALVKELNTLGIKCNSNV